MNKHFEDTRYYLTRAAQTTKAGFGEELEPVRARVAALRGEDADEEPSRIDGVRRRIQAFQDRARTRFEGVRRQSATR